MNNLINPALLVTLSLLPFQSFSQNALNRIATGAPLTIAYRESSIPFSYVTPKSPLPIGYSIDICLKIAEAVRKAAGAKDMPIRYVKVDASTRMEAIQSGKADLECGSTSNTAGRRALVDFTIPHFIAGARLLVKRDSGITRIEDLEKKTLVSTQDTVPYAVVDRLNKEHLMGIKIVSAPDHEKAAEMVESGRADAFAMDDVLLFGLAASKPSRASLHVVGKFLTTEPIAIMLRKDDPTFKAVVDAEMRRLIRDKDIYTMYVKWFGTPIPPSNTPLHLPMSYLLRDFWKYPSDKVTF